MNNRHAIVQMGKTLIEKRLVAGSWGNISLRCTKERLKAHIENGSSMFLGKASSIRTELVEEVFITPSGLGYETITVDDIVELDMEGKVLEGNRIPSSEAKLHLAIYKACPEAKAIIHTHSIYASALAAMRKPVPALIEDIVQIIGGKVECAQYALPGTEDLANNAVEALKGRRAVLLANHGAVCWGKTLEDALVVAEVLEKACQIAIICMQCGGGVELSQEDANIMHAFYEEHYSKRQLGKE